MSRYRCSTIASLWTDEAKLARWINVWAAASAATGHPFRFPVLSAQPLTDVRLRAEAYEVEYGHDVAAAAEALRRWLAEAGETDGARWLHYGLCSSDVTDAGLVIALRRADALLDEYATAAIRAVDDLSIRLASVDVVYRTHGQAAQVAGGVFRWRKHSVALEKAIDAVDDATAKLELPAFAGPTGTGGELTLEQRRAIVLKLGGFVTGQVALPGRQGIDRAPIVAWAQAVARVVGACEAFGRDVRLLAQTGLGEVSEGRGEGYRGSSSMPHKRNPTRSERLCGIAPVVRGMVNGLAEAASENWDCHSLEHSSAERIVIPQISELAGFTLIEVASIASSLILAVGHAEDNARRAPADSYAERNRLIREGVDGGEAWKVAKEDRFGREDRPRFPQG